MGLGSRRDNMNKRYIRLVVSLSGEVGLTSFVEKWAGFAPKQPKDVWGRPQSRRVAGHVFSKPRVFVRLSPTAEGALADLVAHKIVVAWLLALCVGERKVLLQGRL